MLAQVHIAIVGFTLGLLLSTALTIALYRRWLRPGGRPRLSGAA